MKKIILVILLSILFFSQAYGASADDLVKNKLTKEVYVSTFKVSEDFGETYVKALDKYFINVRANKDKQALIKLEEVLEPLIKRYSEKSFLSVNEEKTYNLIKNMYYRSKLLRTYYIQ